ncbi:MAG: hypothetical protein EZS28_039328, partial [Streblomastix strix]
FLISLERGLVFQDFQNVRTVLVFPGKRYTSQYSIALAYRSPLQQEVKQSSAHFVLDLCLYRTGLRQWLRYNNCYSMATHNQQDLGVYCQRQLQQIVVFFSCFILLNAVLSTILFSFGSFHLYQSLRILLCALLAILCSLVIIWLPVSFSLWFLRQPQYGAFSYVDGNGAGVDLQLPGP